MKQQMIIEKNNDRQKCNTLYRIKMINQVKSHGICILYFSGKKTSEKMIKVSVSYHPLLYVLASRVPTIVVPYFAG